MLNILKKLINKNQLNTSDLELLLSLEWTNFNNPFNLNQEKALDLIRKRANLFISIYPEVFNLCHKFNLKDRDIIINLLWKLWLPLSLQITEKKAQTEKVFIQGILGSQGTGKTTLTTILTLIIKALDYSSISISLDDFYKTYSERKELQKIDPRLIYRGAPLTHDLNLALNLFNSLENKNTTEILIPRFDKSAYNGIGERADFEKINKPDIILFEGWFVGVRSIDEKLFNDVPDPILIAEDRQFAKDNNKRLLNYLPLWEKLDSLIILYPQDYHFSLQWRKEAEQKMISLGKPGMKDQEIEEFVNYFWRSLHPELFIKPLTKNAKLVDLVIEINQNHLPEKIYKPQQWAKI